VGQRNCAVAIGFPLGVLERVRASLAARPAYLEIFATAFAGLLLEIAYTRIFSFKIYYYFTYPLLGVGLLGIGAGGIAFATFERLRKMPLERLVPVTAFIGAASVLLGYVVIASVQLDIGEQLLSVLEIGKLVLVMLVLLIAFFSVGLVLSAILASAPESAGRLYGADLAGAALAAALAIPLVAYLGPPRTVVLAGLALAIAGLRFARGAKWLFRSGVALIGILVVPVVFWGLLPDPVVARHKAFEQYKGEGKVWFSQWSPVFRVDVAVLDAGERWLLFHDGQPGSGLRFFDGTWDRFRYFDTDPRALPFHVAPKEPKVLIIGAAGGQEILASLYFGASHVTGIELNPVTVSLHTTVFADITGHLAENPRVTLINGDGRWFMAHTRDQYDLIWFVAPDSYAAMNASTSASFVLSESYLYTVEMIRASLARLTPDGVVCTQFGEIDYAGKPNRSTRYLATAREAFREEGEPEFGEHVLVATTRGYLPETVTILGKQAFAEGVVQAFTQQTLRTVDGAVRYAPGRAPDDSPVNQVITTPEPELPAFFEGSRYEVDPVRDNAPFFWHFTRFRDAIGAPPPPGRAVVDYEDSIAEQMTLLFLGVLAVLSGALLFAPLVLVRDAFREMPHKALSGVYFGALGLGFMFLEVASIQKLSLVVGYPTYSLTVTLFSLLLSTGVASLLWSRLSVGRSRVVVTAFAALVAVVLAEHLLLPTIIEHVAGSSLFVRVLVTVLLVLPLGACLGAFLPAGLTTVSRLSARSREFVAWAWAVNGFFSVIASVLATILAMVLGFRNLMLLSLCVYAIGVVAFVRIARQPVVDS
jgi:predicted membrane-bound spermidine synthase